MIIIATHHALHGLGVGVRVRKKNVYTNTSPTSSLLDVRILVKVVEKSEKITHTDLGKKNLDLHSPYLIYNISYIQK